MMRMLARLGAMGVASFALSTLAFSPAAQAKDTLVIGVAQFPASLHPYISSQTVQFFTIGFATRPITAFDTDAHPTCLLCTELPTLQNGLAKIEDLGGGKQGLAVTIKLKPELKWGDGVPLTAQDLLFTWKIGRDPASGFSNNYPWSRATSVDVVDDHTAVLHLPSTLTSYQMWDYILPEHLEAPIRAQGGTQLDYINRTLYNATPTTNGLWNGPYVVSNYQSGNSVELTPNPYWGGEKPAIKRIVVRLIENTAALEANLISGDVDMTPQGIGITTDQAVELQKNHPKDFDFIYKPGFSYERIDVQKDNPFLQDLRVRQALLYAIDRRALVAKLFFGHASVALDWLNAIEPNYTTDVPHYDFDLAKARALLKEAGWTPGSDGICRNAKGDRLSLEISTTSGNRVRELSEAVMQNTWKSVCIEVSIKNQPARTFFGEYMRKRQYTGLAEYANSTRVGLVPSQFYGGDATPTQANNFTGQNWTGFNDPRMNEVMKQAETELDPAKQKALWQEMQVIYATQLPELPLYFREDPDIIPTWLKGYKASGKEDYTSYRAEEWRN
jgi:peptide/nickel transport system substrate-binding protein